MYLRLPGRAAHRGPPPGGGDPRRGLCSTAHRLCCAASRPRHQPWGDLPDRLSDEAMREGREVGRDGVRGIGLPEVDVLPPRTARLGFFGGRRTDPSASSRRQRICPPLITGREPPLEEVLDWLQLAYTADRSGAYVAPASTVLAQSTVAEGDELFLLLLAHLRRRYPEVYGPAVAVSQAPECRDLQIGEGEGLSGGTSVHNSIKLGTYAGRFTNLSLAGMDNTSPNLTTVYLDTPIVGTTSEPLEYAPLPGRLGQPSGYPLISRVGGPSTSGSNRRPPSSPPPYSTHPQMNPPTGWAQPLRVMQPATGPNKNFKIW